MTLENFTVKNANETMGMGGPYIGDLYMGNQLISSDVVARNLIYNEQLGALFYVKCHRINRYIGFTINFYKTKEQVSLEFSREFDMVYIGKFISEYKIEIYNAFHGNLAEYKEIFDINDEDFGLENNSQ